MSNIKILFAGDYCVRFKGIDYLYEEKMNEVAAPIKAVTEKHDFSVVNVETVFTDNPTPVKKSGPALSSPTKALELLGKMGFSIGAFANNHTMDQGAETAFKSRDAVKNLGMMCVGMGKNLDEANEPCRIEKDGKKISIFNFAENEFVAATPVSAGFAPFDPVTNMQLVKEEKKNADYVFAYLHAGSEHCPFPKEILKKYCHALIENGADGVIISHPHCPLGIEYHMDKPIVYSLGNFYMPKRSEVVDIWGTGYMASIEIADGTVSVTPIPYEFGVDGSFFKLLDGEEKAKYLEYIDELSKLITDTPWEEYRKLQYAWGVLFHREAMEGYLELFLTDKNYYDDLQLYIRNAFSCESHTATFRDYYYLFTEGKTDEYEEYIKKIQELRKRPI